ncbi:MAG: DNA adenine methylase [Bacteroidales bacterium]
MKYMGSKSKIKKEIIPIIQSYVDNGVKFYLEPFCGGCNVIDSIQHKNRLASDNHYFLIEMFKNLDKVKELNDMIRKVEYDEARTQSRLDLRTLEDWYIGAVGFLSSYNGRWFDGGYNGNEKAVEEGTRNYFLEAKNNLLTQSPLLDGVRFKNCDYTFYNKHNCVGGVIYCDIPYKNTKQYSTSKGFDHDKFWQWVREMSEFNVVLVSEETASNDMTCIWEKEVKRTINTSNKFLSTEKLFIYKG